VLLQEEGLAERSLVYATDLHDAPLRQAAAGAFPLVSLQQAEARYRAAGGTARLAKYYKVTGERGVFRPELRKNVLFASHNYMTDASFNEFDVVLCRDLLPELSPGLQQRVQGLLYDSLAPGGYLMLGEGDDVGPKLYGAGYEAVDERRPRPRPGAGERPAGG
jgi:chemotaxis protein methyltransferase CheR